MTQDGTEMYVGANYTDTEMFIGANYTDTVTEMYIGANHTDTEMYVGANDTNTNLYQEDFNTDIGLLTDTNNTYTNVYTEDYTLLLTRVIFVCIGLISITVTTFALVILRKTKKIPPGAKMLSFWLLTFDLLYIVFACVGKLFTNPDIHMTTLSMTFIMCSYLTICLMTVERLFVFNWPNIYMKHFTVEKLRKIMYSVWLTNLLLFYTVRYGACYLQHRSTLIFTQKGHCRNITNFYYGFLLCLVTGVSTACYFKIFSIIRLKTKHTQQSLASIARDIKTYKHTSIVLVYLIVIVLTSIGYAVVLLCRVLDLFNGTEIRALAAEIIALVNCIFDPLLYVMWFKESRMELLKLLCSRSKAAQRKAEEMRREIFCIVTNV